jgi:excinuclease ABC subunit C
VFVTEEQGVFTSFGPSAYFASARRCESRDLPRDGKGRRRLICQSVPFAPGVYGMIDGVGELIYVGKSRRLSSRLMSYFPALPSGEKSERIGRWAKRLVWETAPHEFLALLRELELIRRFRPRFNIEGRMEHQHPAFIYLTAGRAPHFAVAGEVPQGCATYFGPLQGLARHREAVEQLNRRFLLRDCPQTTPMRFADQRKLFAGNLTPACLRFDLGTCLGPCAGLCTSRKYSQAVQQALAFLRGEDRSMLTSLEQAMREAAKERAFERAAVLRDAWRRLAVIDRGLGRLRELRSDYSFVYELRCRKGERTWVFLREGHAAGALVKPRGMRAARAALRRTEEIYGHPEAPHEDDLDMLRLIGSWFRTHERELRRVGSVAEAAAYCQALIETPPVKDARQRSAARRIVARRTLKESSPENTR